MWYNIGCFIFMFFFVIGMLVVGSRANRKQAQHDFYLERISEREQELRDIEQREAQKREQEMKIAHSKAKGSMPMNKTTADGYREPEETKNNRIHTEDDQDMDSSALLRKNNRI